MRNKQSLEKTCLDLAEVMLVVLDAKGLVKMVNRKTCAMLGLDESRIVGKDWVENFIPASSREELREVFKRLSIGEVAELKYYENPICTAEGEEPVIGWHNAYLKEDGHIVGTISVGQDITQRLKSNRKLRDALKELRETHRRVVETQQQLVQSEKLETVGRLARGVAHEIKNPLMILLQGTDYLNGHSELSEVDRQVVAAMREAVENADSIVQKLMVYSAQRDLSFSWDDSAEIVQEALQRVNNDLVEHNIRLQTHYQADLPAVYVDRGRMLQAFTNVFANAIQSMPEGGTLSVKVEVSDLVESDPGVGYRRSDPFKIGDRALRVTVEDSGEGVSDECLEHAFDPFYSTKPAGSGPGMGLPIVKQILEMHRGAVSLSNLHNRGVCVNLLLPISPGRASD